jgi:hypothetical protein
MIGKNNNKSAMAHDCGANCLLHDTVQWDMNEETSPNWVKPAIENISPLTTLDPRVKKTLETRCRFEATPLLPSPLLQDVPPHIMFPKKRYTCQSNAHPMDKRVVALDEPHVYFLDGRCDNVISSTAFVHAFFPHFDDQGVAASTLKSATFASSKHRPTYKYHGCENEADILKCWKRAQELGTRLHTAIELYLNGEPYEIEPDNTKCFQQFLNFYQDVKFRTWEVYRTEWAIFDPELRVAGKIDYLGMRDDGTFVMLDWKRTENISDRSFNAFRKLPAEMGYGVCSHMENCNFMTYSLQQNLYKYILETHYGIRVSKMLLIQMHPKLTDVEQANGKKIPLPVVVMVPNLQHVIRDMLACRKMLMQ